jgi:hypothetical protein
VIFFKVEVVLRDNPDWWFGTQLRTGKEGWYPQSYCRYIEQRKKGAPSQEEPQDKQDMIPKDLIATLQDPARMLNVPKYPY